MEPKNTIQSPLATNVVLAAVQAGADPDGPLYRALSAHLATVTMPADLDGISSLVFTTVPVTVALPYGTEAHPITTASRMNEIVAAKTRGMITDVFNDAELKTAVMILSAAVVFDQPWRTVFQTVRKAKFNTLAGPVMCDMMFNDVDIAMVNFTTIEGKSFTVLEIPYVNDFAMRIVFRNDIRDTDYSAPAIDEERWSRICKLPLTKAVRKATIGLPKWTCRHHLDLTETLEAKFPGLFKSGELDAFFKNAVVSKAAQDAFIEVTEKGTRAAAFMYMEMTRSIPAPREMLVLDRPFAFAVKNDKGVVYFTGEVVNPLMM